MEYIIRQNAVKITCFSSFIFNQCHKYRIIIKYLDLEVALTTEWFHRHFMQASKLKLPFTFWDEYLKTLYTFGNSQRPVFSLGVSHHQHKTTSLWQLGLNWSSKLQENDERKTPLLDEFVCFQIGIKDF